MKQFPTSKEESFQSKLKRFAFNFFPAYRRAGGRICFLSDDWKEIHIKLSLKWTTRNYVGSVFGGSIYGAIDPIYMIQLINILGKDYIVWDKSAVIKFLRPIKHTVYSRFLISDEQIKEIKEKIKANKECEIELFAEFQDKEDKAYAIVSKTIYIADVGFYKTKKLD